MVLKMHAIDICCSVIWNPSGESDQVVSVDDENLRLWDLNMSTNTAKVRYTKLCAPATTLFPEMCVASHIALRGLDVWPS